MLKPHERNDHFRFSSKSQKAEKRRDETRREESSKRSLRHGRLTLPTIARKHPDISRSHAESENPSWFHPPPSSQTSNPHSDLGELSPAPLLPLKLSKFFCQFTRCRSHDTIQIIYLLGCQKKSGLSGLSYRNDEAGFRSSTRYTSKDTGTEWYDAASKR